MCKCEICQEIRDRKSTSIILINNGLGERIVLETSNFIVVPTIGSYVLCYFLIIPKKHYTCFAQLPIEYNMELQYITNTLRQFYHEVFGKSYILFEHGSFLTTVGNGKSIVHAHLHAMPAKYTLIDSLCDGNKLDIKLYIQKSMILFNRKIFNQNSYLYVKDSDSKQAIISCADIKSQFLREKTYNIYHDEIGWNWREQPHVDIMRESILVFKKWYRKRVA